MSEPAVTPPAPEPQPRPASPSPPAAPANVAPATRFSLLSVALTFSFLFNCGALVVLAIVCFGVLTLRGPLDPEALANAPLNETVTSGNATAKDKIAIIHIDGVIMEGLLNYPHKQIEQAADDDRVKAIVLRINSPGGSITASDDLHRRIVKLKEGTTTPEKLGPKKPVIVSMGSLAASGGYYIAAPAQTIVAERTTMTCSIGVYSAFPNASGFLEYHKLDMITIKQGEIKDSGSPFKKMSDHERRVWQDMVDHAYLQFIKVVEEGRPELEGKLLEEIKIKPMAGQEKLHHPEAKGDYNRYRADGGIFTADDAEKFGLIDKIGYLDDALALAQKAAGLGEYKAIEYSRPKPPIQWLLGIQAKPSTTGLLDPGQVKNGFVPRLWYLMPGSEISGILAGMETPND
jgi:protease-4